MASERKILEDIKNLGRFLSESLGEAEFLEKAIQARNAKELTEELSELEAAHDESLQSVKEEYDQSVGQVKNRLQDIQKNFGQAEVDWDHKLWQDYHPNAEGEIPYLVRFGSLTKNGQFGSLEMPALLPLIGGRNIIIKARGKGKELAREVMQAIILRLLGAMPPGKLRLLCIDPVGLGSTVAGFIKGLPDSMTGGQAWFDERQIEQSLIDLENRMAIIKQKYLGVRFSNMEEYNQKAGQVEEPYRLLVISDFPARFSDSSAQRLTSIATNGPSTGVYLLAMVDADQEKLPYGFNLQDIERNSIVIHIDDSQVTWIDQDYKDSNVQLDKVPRPADFERVIRKVNEAAIAASDVRVPYADFLPEEKSWWQADSRKGIHVPVGQFGARETQHFTLDEKLLSSALVVGKTGSGKSTLLHVLISGLIMNYSPDEIELYLLDFKQVEFKDYGINRLPHARVVAVKSEREFGLSVLRGLDGELQRRKDLFANMTSLSEYRDKTGENLPRILLIADEFQELFSYDDALQSDAELILDRLIRQGRAFGINVLLASQTLAGPNSLPNPTKNQVPVRVALQCSDADSRLILSDENDQARLLERPGEAIFNSANGRIEGNNRFQVAWLGDVERDEWLFKIRQFADQKPEFIDRTPIIFDGDALAELQNNAQFMDFLEQEEWPAVKRGHVVHTWLGEPIEIKSHTAATFRRQSRSNLLIVGQRKHERDAMGMMTSALLSLAIQQNPEHATFFILNLTDVDAPWYETIMQIGNLLPHTTQTFRRKEVPAALDQIYTELQKRLDEEEDSSWPSLYLFAFGLHRARDLRKEDSYSSSFSFDSYDEEPSSKSPTEMLSELVREGPDVGIHTLVWCDTFTNLSRVFERRDIGDFEMRVALPMGSEDSHNLIDSESATSLAPHRAIYFDEERMGGLEKFRPYGLLPLRIIQEWGRRLENRAKSGS